MVVQKLTQTHQFTLTIFLVKWKRICSLTGMVPEGGIAAKIKICCVPCIFNVKVI